MAQIGQGQGKARVQAAAESQFEADYRFAAMSWLFATTFILILIL